MAPIVVVGGGIVGASVAFHLRNADRDVILYERDTPGAGTTGDSIAQFVTHQEDPDPTEYRLRERAWEWYSEHAAAGRFSFEQIGTLHAAGSPETMTHVEDLVARHRELGVDVELRSAADLAEFGIAPSAVEGGAYFPRDGYLDPAEIVQYFLGEAADAGVGIETGVAVTDVLTEGGAVAGVETSDGTVEASAVVNAAGPWSGRIDDMVGVSLPIRHTYGPILVLRADHEVRMPLTFFDEGYYLREEGRDQVFAGRFAVDYGNAHDLDPDRVHRIDQEFHLGVGDLLATTVPNLADADVTGEWVGLRTVTPDGHPIVGPTGLDGYYVACGMSGYGIVRAPVVGEVLADLVTDATDGTGGEFRDHVSPDRFG
ncbi:FAD-binding oxidoreductase [Halobacteriales archaeon QS_1_68_17]|nr:MAG: FAD-binding oxidoreductase [Halobacteriales archaeon QS_1_68_17]